MSLSRPSRPLPSVGGWSHAGQMTEVTAQRTERGVRVTGVRRYLGYTDTNFFTDEDARTLASWLRRDGDLDAAEAVEAVLDDC